MKTKLTNRPVEQVIAAIEALDLDSIKLKLMDPEEGQGWSREYADGMELAYKRFLMLLVTHSEETIAPNKDVDKFWHGHILDTLKYAEDCQNVFGNFLHHFPYFGMRGEEDAKNLAAAARNMKRLYQQEFGSAQDHSAAWSGIRATAEKAAFCSAAVQAKDVAFCSTAVQAKDVAFCSAAVQAKDVAFCSAVVQAKDVAFCSAAVQVNNSVRAPAAVV